MNVLDVNGLAAALLCAPDVAVLLERTILEEQRKHEIASSAAAVNLHARSRMALLEEAFAAGCRLPYGTQWWPQLAPLKKAELASVREALELPEVLDVRRARGEQLPLGAPSAKGARA